MKPSTDLFERIRFRGQPQADPHSVVTSGKARFTVLSERLLRLEWSESGEFEERGSFAFPTRRAAVPQFTSAVEGKHLTINTDALRLRYLVDSGRFSATNLSIQLTLNGREVSWTPGKPNPGNLRGTRRTVDGCEGDAALDEGILSRSGWALFDDSRSVLFNIEDGWVAPRPEHDLQDWYFFGYGHDYRGGLADYMRFGGKIPLIPRFVLGGWWSRYWAYSSQDIKDIVNGFEAHDLPLDVFIIDMDWHKPDAWTGYSWNRELIPDPPALLDWLHQKGLKIALNLHPAQGVQAFEDAYPEFARNMGMDPALKATVPFQITNKNFVKNYFEMLHHPMEELGVDFWWMDWQQGDASEMKGLDPLIWLNHTHFEDSARTNGRKMVYSRWGGLGNHRYQTGFSGDTYVGWPALQFQPYFTATASNVGYGWWEHDIGGHMGGATEPELFARWVQFGALSPALKLHATKDPRTERRPWVYPEATFQACKTAFHWRYQLIPYIYSMARKAYDTGVSLCRPMYYEYPEVEDAYAARFQYFYGDQMIAAPIVFPTDPGSGLASMDVWVPQGTWTDYLTRETFTGPRWARLTGGLNQLPMLMKEGAILPLAPDFKGANPQGMASGGTTSQPKDRLVLAVFPGKEGSFRLYEDDGVSESFNPAADGSAAGQFEWTQLRMSMPSRHEWEVRVEPVEGLCAALPTERAYEIRLEGSHKPERVLLNGVEMKDWTYQAESLTTVIHTPMLPKNQGLSVKAESKTSLAALDTARSRRLARADAARLLGKSTGTQAELLEQALQETGAGSLTAASAVARLGGPWVSFQEFVTPEEAANQLGRVIVGGPENRREAYDLEVTFSLLKAGGPITSIVEMKGVRGSRIVDTPFAYDGRTQSMGWEAEVKLTWRGRTLVSHHKSGLLMPAIPAYRGLIYNPDQQMISAQAALHPTDLADWKTYVFEPQRVPNLKAAFFVPLFEDSRALQGNNEALAAYLVTHVTSRQKRAVTLLFQAAGKPEIYLNGQKVTAEPVEAGALAARYMTRPITPYALGGLTLKEGENTLMVWLRPTQEVGWRPWYFGGIIVGEDGGLVMDLSYATR